MAEREYLHRDHWDLLAMKAFFRPDRCEKNKVVQFRSRTLTAWVEAGPEGITHGMGSHESPDLLIESTISEFHAEIQDGYYFYNDTVTRFAECFDVPERQPTMQI